jgi:hypothetical protein
MAAPTKRQFLTVADFYGICECPIAFCFSLLCNDSCGKKVSYTWIHKDKKAFSTLSHVGRVIENDFLTLKQRQKNVANLKQDTVCKQSCGFLKKFFFHIKN